MTGLTSSWSVDDNLWDGEISPYVAWWALNEGRQDLEGDQLRLDDDDLRDTLLSCLWAMFRRIAEAFELCGDETDEEAFETLREHFEAKFPEGSTHHALKAFSINPFYSDGLAEDDRAVDVSSLTDASLPPDNSVLIGVIDSAIALGNERFTYADGSSRMLWSWQQGAKSRAQQSATADPDAPDMRVPFGREMLKPEIDAALARNSIGGRLDEDGFNRDVGLSDTWTRGANNEVDYISAHGTHVMDLAAGANPHDPTVKEAALRRAPILAVTLPDHLTIGTSGNFLEYFLYLAVGRLVEAADAINAERRARAEARGEVVCDLPLVINMSYGLHAGPKDSTTKLENFLSLLIENRLRRNRPPLRYVLPAGNNNLAEGNALWRLERGGEARTLDWRVMPEDQSSNYIEIWSEDFDPDAADLPLAIQLVAPDGRETAFEVGPDKGVMDVFGRGRVYCRRVTGTMSQVDPDPDADLVQLIRQRYVVCLSPSLNHTGAPAAPAGLWKLRLRIPAEASHPRLDVNAGIQLDQSSRSANRTALLSYFDDPHYVPFDEDGAERDTYLWTVLNLTEEQADLESYDKFGPVQRKGTLNAIASLPNAVVIGGYRMSDGKPAPYSSTGSDRRKARIAPTQSYPTDDGPAHPGLLAAGSRSASAVLMQGTSFATALATRNVADALAGWDGAPDWLYGSGSARAESALAQASEQTNPYFGRAFSGKSGHGRRQKPDTGRVPRLDDMPEPS